MSLYKETIGTGTRLALVHGFTQNGRCWEPLASWLSDENEVVLIDAPGHGLSQHDGVDLKQASQLVLEAGGSAAYVGYSMGARILLHGAVAEAQISEAERVIEQLVLIGATAGIDSELERADRRRSDEELAETVEDLGTRGFIDQWLARPMFADLSEEASAKKFRMGNRSAGLAASLRHCGTGTQLPLWDQLSEIEIPVTLIVGDQDEKFGPVAERMALAIGDNAAVVTLPGGHAVHMENPEAVMPYLEDLTNPAGSSSSANPE